VYQTDSSTNACGHQSILSPSVEPLLQMPASVSNALQQLGSSMDPAGNEALRFPLSVGERREDADHTGAPSYVVDAIFNADVVSCLSARRPWCLVHCCLQCTVAQNDRAILTGDDHITVSCATCPYASTAGCCYRYKSLPMCAS
jgi:hypothetical protein